MTSMIIINKNKNKKIVSSLIIENPLYFQRYSMAYTIIDMYRVIQSWDNFGSVHSSIFHGLSTTFN